MMGLTTLRALFSLSWATSPNTEAQSDNPDQTGGASSEDDIKPFDPIALAQTASRHHRVEVIVDPAARRALIGPESALIEAVCEVVMAIVPRDNEVDGDGESQGATMTPLRITLVRPEDGLRLRIQLPAPDEDDQAADIAVATAASRLARFGGGARWVRLPDRAPFVRIETPVKPDQTEADANANANASSTASSRSTVLAHAGGAAPWAGVLARDGATPAPTVALSLDDQTLNDVMQTLLLCVGAQPTPAEHSEDAVALVIDAPANDTMARRIRRALKSGDLPLIGVARADDHDAEARLRIMGVDVVLETPLSVNALRKALDDCGALTAPPNAGALDAGAGAGSSSLHQIGCAPSSPETPSADVYVIADGRR